VAIKRIQVDVSEKGYKSQQDRFYLTNGDMCTIPSSRTENKINVIIERESKDQLQAVPLKFLERNQRNFQGEYSFTIDSAQTGGIQEGKRIRRLTPTECERLQGFPDGWTEYGIDENGNKVKISDTQRYKMLGNAVSVPVVRVIMEKLYGGRTT
jgi:DNA (cytosine-5)-methyltransferase 1